jgi:hypothetical protein
MWVGLDKGGIFHKCGGALQKFVTPEVLIGLGRVVALCHHSSAL